MTKVRKTRKLVAALVVVLVFVAIAAGGAWYVWNRHRHDVVYAECLQTLAPFEGTDAELRFNADFLSKEAVSRMESEAYAVAGEREASALEQAVNDVPSLGRSDIIQCLPSMSFEQLQNAVTTNSRISDSWTDYDVSVQRALDDVEYSIATHEYEFPELFNLVVLGSTMYPLAGNYCRHDGSCISISESGNLTINNMTDGDPLPKENTMVATGAVPWQLQPYYQSLQSTPDQSVPIHLCAATADFYCDAFPSVSYSDGSVASQIDYIASGTDLAAAEQRGWVQYDESNMPDSSTSFLVFSRTYSVVNGEIRQDYSKMSATVSDDDVYYRVTPTRNEES